MKFLLLNGFGIKFHVEKSKLFIKDGKYLKNMKHLKDIKHMKHLNNTKHSENLEHFEEMEQIEQKEYIFRPKRIPYDNIVIYGRSGDISIEAIRWLIKHNVAVSILNWDGKLLTMMLPAESVQVKTKFAQYSTYRDTNLRLELAKNFIEAKFIRSKFILEFLKSRYPSIQYNFSKEEERLEEAVDFGEVLRCEARVAAEYWKQIVKAVPRKYEFDKRQYADTPYGASDKVNCMLNYGYAILESECLRAINIVGLDPHVGFLHEMKMGSKSLAYDLQEPFRFLIDLAVISALEKNNMQDADFIRTENYNLRLKPSGAQKLMEEISLLFNRRVEYRGDQYKWGNVLIEQTRELAHYILGKKGSFDLTRPIFELERDDTEEMRKLILAMPYAKWKKMGYSKGTLHYMKQNAKMDETFNLYRNSSDKLREISK